VGTCELLLLIYGFKFSSAFVH